MSKHTRPWEVIGETASYYLVAERLEEFTTPLQSQAEITYAPVCRVNRHIRTKVNLPLILAAPELLAACKAAARLLETCEFSDPLDLMPIENIDKAIAKATAEPRGGKGEG